MRHRKIKNVCGTDVATVLTDTTIKDIVRLLDQRDVSAVPVVDDARHVVGVVSQADLLVKQGTQEPDWAKGPLAWWRRRRDAHRAEATTAGQLMTSPAITIGPESTVVEAARMMSRHNVKRLPVVDTAGTLVGIVSRKDLLTVFLRKDEDIQADVVEHVFEFGLGMEVNPTTAQVTVHDGVVTITGQLELRSQVELAEAMARHTDGVVDVVANLTHRLDDTHEPAPPRLGDDLIHERWHN